jgi:hypothetical protein
MSTHIVGVRNLDGQFTNMMKVKKACDMAGIGYPQEISKYFKHPQESEQYLRLEMEEMEIKFKEISENGTVCYEVNLKDLPKEVKSIRFSNSW